MRSSWVLARWHRESNSTVCKWTCKNSLRADYARDRVASGFCVCVIYFVIFFTLFLWTARRPFFLETTPARPFAQFPRNDSFFFIILYRCKNNYIRDVYNIMAPSGQSGFFFFLRTRTTATEYYDLPVKINNEGLSPNSKPKWRGRQRREKKEITTCALGSLYIESVV